MNDLKALLERWKRAATALAGAVEVQRAATEKLVALLEIRPGEIMLVALAKPVSEARDAFLESSYNVTTAAKEEFLATAAIMHALEVAAQEPAFVANRSPEVH